MATASANPKVEEIRRSVQSSYIGLNQLIDGPLAALEPNKLYQSPAENEWTIMQNLAHIVEFIPYWAGEIEKLVGRGAYVEAERSGTDRASEVGVSPGQNFGRTMQHEGRLSAIREHSTDSLEQIRAALPGSYARLEKVLSQLKDSDLDLTGHHSTYGEQTLAWFIKEFVTQHFSNHIEQIRKTLDNTTAKQV